VVLLFLLGAISNGTDSGSEKHKCCKALEELHFGFGFSPFVLLFLVELDENGLAEKPNLPEISAE
jgi:hypothetical protein